MTYRWRNGETDAVAEYAPYVLREDIEPEPTPPVKPRVPFNPERCGTTGGRDHHIRTGTPVCDACQTVYLKRQAEHRGRRRANARAGETQNAI